MSHLAEILNGPWARNLACTLLHTLWQGCVISAGLYLFLCCKPVSKAKSRYWMSVVALIGIVLSASLTFSILRFEPTQSEPDKDMAGRLLPPVNPVKWANQADNSGQNVPTQTNPSILSQCVQWVPWAR